MAPQTLVKLSLVGVTLIIQVVLNILLGVFMWRKRRFQASDPIQSSLASARRYTKQLNRINLIAFIMSLQYILTNVPLIVAPSLYWNSLRENLIDFATLKLIVKVIDLFALFMLASRAYMVGWASPKIRREAWQALTCAGESSKMKQLAIDIRPKQEKGSYSSNPDLVSKWDFQEKSIDM